MQQIKGTILKSRLGFVEQHWGRDGVERVVGAVPDEEQKVLGTLRGLVDADLKRVEAAAEAAGVPWTPGRLPEWRGIANTRAGGG